MIRYLLSQKNPASHYIDIHMQIESPANGVLQLQLPAWRPGRYELGNFAKNIKAVEMFDAHNNALPYTKLNKDLWEVTIENCDILNITYSYFAAELNAGACYADQNQLYVNPVHCCLYVVGRTNEPHEVEMQIASTYKIATSLIQKGKTLFSPSYDVLVDSPFVASAGIQTDGYTVNNINFYLHFNGECRPDFEKIKRDFAAFTQQQLKFWGECPVTEYHFIFQVLPFKFYHGVEHLNSTVVAIGPGYAINEGAVYDDVLGVSCHELFHTWNIKTIRPIEMAPYDYTKENYARTGYVYEGFTTYYGDKLLLGSKVFSIDQYFVTLQERLTKHFHNFGRYNLSVAHSSWETWLDGYLPGAPYRKTNIYDEGCLIAFMLDVKIMQATQNKKTLRDVCVLMYERFGKKHIGYTEQEVMDLVNEVSSTDFSTFFKDYVYTANDFKQPLLECFAYLGIDLIEEKSLHVCENNFGFKYIENGYAAKITMVAPNSPAWEAGLFIGDEIIAVNKVTIKNNLNPWLLYYSKDAGITLMVNSGEQLKTLTLTPNKDGTTYFFNPVLKLNNGPSNNNAFTIWQQL